MGLGLPAQEVVFQGIEHDGPDLALDPLAFEGLHVIEDLDKENFMFELMNAELHTDIKVVVINSHITPQGHPLLSVDEVSKTMVAVMEKKLELQTIL